MLQNRKSRRVSNFDDRKPRWVVIQTASLQAISLKTMRNSSSSKFETLNLGLIHYCVTSGFFISLCLVGVLGAFQQLVTLFNSPLVVGF